MADRIREVLSVGKYLDILESLRSNKIKESMERHCSFYKAKDGRWYMELADKEYGDRNKATTYGPFYSKDRAMDFLDNFSNPGSFYIDGSGKLPEPKKSPNNTPVVLPEKFNQRGRRFF